MTIYELAADEGERLRFGEVEILVKASAETTGGAFTLFEEREPVDTPLHIHEHEDELFYVPVTSCTRRAACPTPRNVSFRAPDAFLSSPPPPAWKDSFGSSPRRTVRVAWVPRHTRVPPRTTA